MNKNGNKDDKIHSACQVRVTKKGLEYSLLCQSQKAFKSFRSLANNKVLKIFSLKFGLPV